MTIKKLDIAWNAGNAASERRPTDFAVQQTLGGFFFDIGDWEKPVQALERALAPLPSPAEAPAIERKLNEARSRAIGSDPSAPR